MYANQYLTFNQFVPGQNMEHTIIADTIEYAEDSFVDAKERLLDVKNWKRYCAQPGVNFILKDSHGREVNRRAHKGDHINIQMPGAEHRCCVIEALEYDDYPDLHMETFTMRIRPCAHSVNNEEYDDEHLAEAAIIIERRNKQVFAIFYTRNMAVTDQPAASQFGLTETAWNSLLSRFVD